MQQLLKDLLVLTNLFPQADEKLFVELPAMRRNQMVEQLHGGNRTGEMIL
jgi:hypothetical protein